jgi:hypothetical protein
VRRSRFYYYPGAPLIPHAISLNINEWDKITMKEIRARIDEMPDRCKKLIETGGIAIKSARW